MSLSIQDGLQLFTEELYQYFTPSFLEELARELNFVQRKRKFSGHNLATICVWVSQLHAVTGTLMSPEGLNKRFNKKAVFFFGVTPIKYPNKNPLISCTHTDITGFYKFNILSFL